VGAEGDGIVVVKDEKGTAPELSDALEPARAEKIAGAIATDKTMTNATATTVASSHWVDRFDGFTADWMPGKSEPREPPLGDRDPIIL
jgi:hypothetical protein